MFQLTYLISSISKRDAVGRKPKRKVFAQEGLLVIEKEMKKELLCQSYLQSFFFIISRFYFISIVDRWAEPWDADDIEERLVKIKADLLSEMIAVRWF